MDDDNMSQNDEDIDKKVPFNEMFAAEGNDQGEGATESKMDMSLQDFSKPDAQSVVEVAEKNLIYAKTNEKNLDEPVKEFIAEVAKLKKGYVLSNQDACNIFQKVKTHKVPWLKVQSTLSSWDESFSSVPYREFIACFLAVHTRKSKLQKAGDPNGELATYMAESFTLGQCQPEHSSDKEDARDSSNLEEDLRVSKKPKLDHSQESAPEDKTVRLHYLEHRNKILELENTTLKEKNKVLARQNRSLEINLSAWRHKVVRQVIQQKQNKVKNKYKKQKQKGSNCHKETERDTASRTDTSGQKTTSVEQNGDMQKQPELSLRTLLTTKGESPDAEDAKQSEAGHSGTRNIPRVDYTPKGIQKWKDTETAKSSSQSEPSSSQFPANMDQEVLDMVDRISAALAETMGPPAPQQSTEPALLTSPPVKLSQDVQLLLPNTVSAALVRTGADGNTEENSEMAEITEFARQFRLRRLNLGLTQGQVSDSLQIWQGLTISKGSICRFEHLDITPKKALREKPIFEKWLHEAESQCEKGLEHLAEFIGSQPKPAKKRNYSKALNHLGTDSSQTDLSASSSMLPVSSQDYQENPSSKGIGSMISEQMNDSVHSTPDNAQYVLSRDVYSARDYAEAQGNFSSSQPDASYSESLSKLPTNLSDFEGDDPHTDYSLSSINQNFKIPEPGSSLPVTDNDFNQGGDVKPSDNFRLRVMEDPYPVFLLGNSRHTPEKNDTNASSSAPDRESGQVTIFGTTIKQEPKDLSQCSVCLEMFDSDILLQHLSTHLNAGDHDNERQGEQQSEPGVLNLAKRIKEEPQEQHQCAVCLQTFPDVILLQQHLPTHLREGEPDIHTQNDIDEERMQDCTQCPNCQLYFTKRGLYKHLRSCKKRLYRCTVCEKALCKSSEELQKHMSSCRKIYRCTVCKAVYKSLEAMKQHFVSCRSKGLAFVQ